MILPQIEIGMVEAGVIGGAIGLIGRSLIAVLATIWRDIKEGRDQHLALAVKSATVIEQVTNRLEDMEDALRASGVVLPAKAAK